MNCKKCGNELREGAQFCSACGTRVMPASCRVCGSKLLEDEKFCPACGTPVTPARHSSPAPQLQLDELTEKLRSGTKYVREHVPANLDALSEKAGNLQKQLQPQLQIGVNFNHPAAYLIVALMQIVMVFLWFGALAQISVSSLGLNESETLTFHQMCTDAEYLSYFTVVILIVGAVFTLLAAVVSSRNKLRRLLVPKIASFWATFMYAVALIGIYVTVQDYQETLNGYSRYVKINAAATLTPGGYVFGFLCIGSLVLLFLMSVRKKRVPQRRRSFEYDSEEL